MHTITLSTFIEIRDCDNAKKIKLVPVMDSDGLITIVAFASYDIARRQGWRYIFKSEDGGAKILTPTAMKKYIGKQVLIYNNYISPISSSEIFRMRAIGFKFDFEPDKSIKTTRSMIVDPNFAHTGKLVIPSLWASMSFDESIVDSRAIFVIAKEDDYDSMLVAICNSSQYHLGIEYSLLIDRYCVSTPVLGLVIEWLERGGKKITDYEYQSFGKLKDIPFLLFKEKNSVRTDNGRFISPVCGANELGDGSGAADVKPTKIARRDQRKIIVPGKRRRLWNRSERARVQANIRKDRSLSALELDDF